MIAYNLRGMRSHNYLQLNSFRNLQKIIKKFLLPRNVKRNLRFVN